MSQKYSFSHYIFTCVSIKFVVSAHIFAGMVIIGLTVGICNML